MTGSVLTANLTRLQKQVAVYFSTNEEEMLNGGLENHDMVFRINTVERLQRLILYVCGVFVSLPARVSLLLCLCIGVFGATQNRTPSRSTKSQKAFFSFFLYLLPSSLRPDDSSAAGCFGNDRNHQQQRARCFL